MIYSIIPYQTYYSRIIISEFNCNILCCIFSYIINSNNGVSIFYDNIFGNFVIKNSIFTNCICNNVGGFSSTFYIKCNNINNKGIIVNSCISDLSVSGHSDSIGRNNHECFSINNCTGIARSYSIVNGNILQKSFNFSSIFIENGAINRFDPVFNLSFIFSNFYKCLTGVQINFAGISDLTQFVLYINMNNCTCTHGHNIQISTNSTIIFSYLYFSNYFPFKIFKLYGLYLPEIHHSIIEQNNIEYDGLNNSWGSIYNNNQIIGPCIFSFLYPSIQKKLNLYHIFIIYNLLLN